MAEGPRLLHHCDLRIRARQAMTIQQQVKCADRELGKRRALYPRMIDQRKLTQAKADEEIAGMAAIVATLTRLQHLAEVSEEIRVPIVPEAAPQNEKQKLTQAKLL
jgi:hypothetical protein